MSERRKQILETFGKVPFLVQDAESSFEDFASDEILKEAIVDLYLAILETVGVMMEWLVDKGSCRYLYSLIFIIASNTDKFVGGHIRALLEGPGYKKDLNAMIQTIHERSKAIQNRAYRLTRGITCKTAITIQKMENQMGSVRKSTERIEVDIDETKLGVKSTEAVTIESRSDIKQIMSDFAQKNQKDEEMCKRQEEANKNSGIALSNLKDLMQNQAKSARCTSENFAIEANGFDFNLRPKQFC